MRTYMKFSFDSSTISENHQPQLQRGKIFPSMSRLLYLLSNIAKCHRAEARASLPLQFWKKKEREKKSAKKRIDTYLSRRREIHGDQPINGPLEMPGDTIRPFLEDEAPGSQHEVAELPEGRQVVDEKAKLAEDFTC